MRDLATTDLDFHQESNGLDVLVAEEFVDELVDCIPLCTGDLAKGFWCYCFAIRLSKMRANDRCEVSCDESFLLTCSNRLLCFTVS